MIRPWDEDDDGCGCGHESVLAQVVIACAPIVVTHLLDVRRDRERAALRPQHEQKASETADSFGAYVARRRGER